MGFIARSLKLIMVLFIIFIVLSMLNSSGIRVFGSTFYTELGFTVFITANFLDWTFSLHK